MRGPHSVLLVACALFGACTNFDREDRIEDLRVLAVRTEPAEILYNPLYAFTRPDERPPGLELPGVDMQVEVFAVEPRGGLVRSEVRLCPDGNFACVDFDPSHLFADLGGEPRIDLEEAYLPRAAETDVDLERDPAGQLPGLRFDWRFTEAVIDSIVPRTAGGDPIPSFFPELPRFAIDLESKAHAEVTRETAFKRVPVGVDLWDPSLPPEFRDTLSVALGIQLCDERVPDEEYVEGRTDCVEPRGPNQNPALIGFDVLAPDEEPEDGVRTAETSDLGLSSVLSVPRGGVVSLMPVFAPGTLERYQVLSFDIEASTLTIENRREDLALSWYTTRGDAFGETSLQFGGHFGVDWSLPFSGIEPGERDVLVLVARDQRGGTAVARVTVEYR